MNAIALESQSETHEEPVKTEKTNSKLVEQYERSGFKRSFESLENVPEITKKAVEWLILESDIPEKEKEALVGGGNTRFIQDSSKPPEEQEFAFQGKEIRIPINPVETINRERENEANRGYYEVLAERLGVDVEKVLDPDIVPAELLATVFTFHEIRHRIKLRLELPQEMQKTQEQNRVLAKFRGIHEPDPNNGGSIFEIAKRGKTPDISEERWQEVVDRMQRYTTTYKNLSKEVDADEWAVKQLAGFIEAQKENVNDVEM